MTYQYSYLIGDLTILVIWIILFFYRKDIRKEMLSVSVIFGFIGFIAGPVFAIDWWHPLTITNTIINFENFLFGFVVAGIAAVIYEEIFKKKVKLRKINKEKKAIRIIFLMILGAALFFGVFFILNLHSFWASLVATLGVTSIIWIRRKDLIIDSLFSGFLLTLISFLFFIVPELFKSGWVLNHWYFENLTGIIILKAPLEDLIWFFTVGLLIGPLYEFWQEGRLKRYIKTKKLAN